MSDFPNVSNLLVYQAGLFRLRAIESPGERRGYELFVPRVKGAIPVNEVAALVWQLCQSLIPVSALIEELSECYPDASDISEDVIGVLRQLAGMGAVAFTDGDYPQLKLPFDHVPVLGQSSEKALRLVDYCLGDYASEPILPCSGNYSYLNCPHVLLMEIKQTSIQLTSGIEFKCFDQKQIAKSFLKHKLALPRNLSCWLVTGDAAGDQCEKDQGLHLSTVRRTHIRHPVLVPGRNRNRYLGAELRSQMTKLRQDWTPWDQKSDTVWWGGALTGRYWVEREPFPLTRIQVLRYFKERPNEKVILHLSDIPSGSIDKEFAPEVKGGFEKADAFKHKCVMLLPGNDIASGISWYFSGNSVVLMSEPHIEHIHLFEIEPWVHYVPLESDPGDVIVKLNWVLNHQDEAQQIVRNAHARLEWLSGLEYQWAMNEVLSRISAKN